MRVLIAPGLFLFLAACAISDPDSKGVRVEVQGTVSWAGVSTPVSGVTLTLLEWYPHVYDPGVDSNLLASATTDADGKFSFAHTLAVCKGDLSIFADGVDAQTYGLPVAGVHCQSGVQVINIQLYPRTPR